MGGVATGLVVSGVTSAAGQTVPAALKLRIAPRRVTFGHRVAATGRAPASDAGHGVVLEAADGAGGPWRALASTRIGRRGGFRFRVHPRSSGVLRAVEQPVRAQTATDAVAAAAGPVTSYSPSQPVRVAARFTVPARQFAILGAGRVRVSGALLPAAGGRVVALQDHTHRGWDTVTHSRTGRRGGFTLRFAPRGGTNRRLRVLFAGDRSNARTTRRAGTVSVFTPSVASWYDDAGETACGYHAGLGVANKTLPCGTHVAFHFGGRTVHAVVDDRGPYVAGRDWDLNQNTAAALGFAGVGTVWVSGA